MVHSYVSVSQVEHVFRHHNSFDTIPRAFTTSMALFVIFPIGSVNHKQLLGQGLSQDLSCY